MNGAEVRRFVLFAGDHYYPIGGWEDRKGSFDTADEAKAAYTPCEYGWAHVADLQADAIVAHQEGLSLWEDGAYDD